MSARSSRGSDFDVAASAKLDPESAARFAARREATLVENAQRAQRREGCLRDSALTGGAAGLLGGSLAFRQLTNPKARTQFTRSLLGISVSGQAIGGAGQAFVVFVGFFMPFMFISNVVRWRCQKAGLKTFEAPKAGDPQLAVR